MHNYHNININCYNNIDNEKENYLAFTKQNNDIFIDNEENELEIFENFINNNLNIYTNDISGKESYDNEEEEKLMKKIFKLKKQLKKEEKKVKSIENIIKELGKIRKEKEEKNFNLLKIFNERQNDIKIQYKIYENELLDRKNEKENLYENKINILNREIKNLEYENMKINQKINESKNIKKILENKFLLIEKKLQNDLQAKNEEIEEFREKLEKIQQEMVDKEEAYEQKIKELNLKSLNLKEEINNKIDKIRITSFPNSLSDENESLDDSLNNNINLNGLRKSYSNNYIFYNGLNDFNQKGNNKLIIENINHNFQNLRKKINALQNKSIELTRILSSKYEESEELNKEIERLKEKINKNNNIGNGTYLFNDNNNNSDIKNNIERIANLKITISNYKNNYYRIKEDLNKMNKEHKIKINEIVISYEKKIKKLIEKINNLKRLKNNIYTITDDIKDNLFDQE